MAKRSVPFEHSSELKRTFNQLSELWCKKNRLGLGDLAERCGVSLQYLSHIGRYGRIPSKPILTLLAFNLEVSDPGALFRTAGIKDPWPYENGIGLRAPSPTESGLLSVNLDMRGFTSVIREIVRAEVQPKRLEDLLGRRPLRVGLNRGQFFLFENHQSKSAEGFFPEVIRSIAVALNAEIEFIDVPHDIFLDKLEDGAIDCYGPVYRTASRMTRTLFSRPFCTVPLATLVRTRKAPPLVDIPEPKRFSDLRKRGYVIAVHRDSMAHHFVENVLGITGDRLIACEVPEEALERIMLAKLPRAAHVMVTDLPYAELALKENGTALKLLSAENEPDIVPFEDSIAVRLDWQPLLSAIDQALEFLVRNGALRRIHERHSGTYNNAIEVQR